MIGGRREDYQKEVGLQLFGTAKRCTEAEALEVLVLTVGVLLEEAPDEAQVMRGAGILIEAGAGVAAGSAEIIVSARKWMTTRSASEKEMKERRGKRVTGGGRERTVTGREIEIRKLRILVPASLRNLRTGTWKKMGKFASSKRKTRCKSKQTVMLLALAC